MKRFSVVLAVLAVILASQNAFSKPEAELKPIGKGFQTKNGETPFETPSSMSPFLPNDIVYSESNHVGKKCDSLGNYVNNEDLTPWCKPVHSPSTGAKYIIRISHKEGNRVFLIKNKKPELFVQFDAGGSITNGSNVVVYASPKALRFAENNGYVIDKRNNTMVAKGSSKDDTQVAQQPKAGEDVAKNEDCASKSSLPEKMKCISPEAVGAVIKGLPKF